MNVRLPLILFSLATWPAIGSAQAPPTIRPAPAPGLPGGPPVIQVILPPPVPTMIDPSWPPRMAIRPLTPPDVSNPEHYPAAARRNEEEGLVVYELLVARNGTPRACRIHASSGFAALDSGTCDLAMKLRFAPPTDQSRTPIEATFRGQIMWQFAPRPLPLAPNEVQVDLMMKDGNVAWCSPIGAGPLFQLWRKTACLMVRTERQYYLGDRDLANGGIRVMVRLFPIGQDLAAGLWPAAQPTAWQRIEFELSKSGEIRRCRTVRSRGFGTLRVNGRYPCGNFFLSQAWFDNNDPDAPPRLGAIEIRVYPAYTHIGGTE